MYSQLRRSDIAAVDGVLEVGLPGMLHVDDYLWFRIVYRGSEVAGVMKPLWRYRQHGLQYGGWPGLDLTAFSRDLRGYITMLSALAEANECSGDLVSFVRERYLGELLLTRTRTELQRARSFSLFSYTMRLVQCVRLGIKHRLNIRALVKSTYS